MPVLQNTFVKVYTTLFLSTASLSQLVFSPLVPQLVVVGYRMLLLCHPFCSLLAPVHPTPLNSNHLLRVSSPLLSSHSHSLSASHLSHLKFAPPFRNPVTFPCPYHSIPSPRFSLLHIHPRFLPTMSHTTLLPYIPLCAPLPLLPSRSPPIRCTMSRHIHHPSHAHLFYPLRVLLSMALPHHPFRYPAIPPPVVQLGITMRIDITPIYPPGLTRTGASGIREVLFTGLVPLDFKLASRGNFPHRCSMEILLPAIAGIFALGFSNMLRADVLAPPR
ncbi:hypothetical protein C8J57DRAFT_1532951 [Mycena rebaudengoi]|nr:hypothetical protein C8J57DRAFT_1532951 [Mycena rebaudengoi]